MEKKDMRAIWVVRRSSEIAIEDNPESPQGRFGTLVKQARRSLGIERKAYAPSLHLDEYELVAIENGLCPPDVLAHYVDDICGDFGIDSAEWQEAFPLPADPVE